MSQVALSEGEVQSVRNSVRSAVSWKTVQGKHGQQAIEALARALWDCEQCWLCEPSDPVAVTLVDALIEILDSAASHDFYRELISAALGYDSSPDNGELRPGESFVEWSEFVAKRYTAARERHEEHNRKLIEEQAERTRRHRQEELERRLAERRARVDDFFTDLEDREPYWSDTALVEGLVFKRLPTVIGGPMKSLKTLLSIDLAAAVATGTSFLGRDVRDAEPSCVFVFTLETPPPVWRTLFTQAVRARGCDPEDALQRLWVTAHAGYLRGSERERFQEAIEARGVELVILDPLYLISPTAEVSNNAKQGRMLQHLIAPIVEAGAAPVIVAHATRDVRPGTSPTLHHLSGSAVGPFARSWLLVNRESEYQGGNVHELLALAGSQGHHQSMGLTFDEASWAISIRDSGPRLPEPAQKAPKDSRSSFLKFPGRDRSNANPKG